jgi:uncharacterized membrane protein
MGKRKMQVKSVRRQVRQIKPKTPAMPTAAADQKKQRERYVASGGMLQGYAPDFVMRVGYISAAVAVVCLLVFLELLLGPLRPDGLVVNGVAAIAWVIPMFVIVSFVLPGFRLAMRDRKREPRVVQGQVLGASTVSTSLGLGMLMVKTRAGNEQFLVAPDKLARVPGNVVQVIVNVTPGLKHVKSLSVMGQRMMPRPDQPTPPVLRQLRLLPLVTPIALTVAVILGDDIVAFLPIANEYIHAFLALIAGAVLGGAVYGASFLMQRRLMTQVQALLPQGL